MKFKSFIAVILLIFSASFFTACTEKKERRNKDILTETSSEIKYQCPMDCEDGKVYDNSGKCSVCKMDLALLSTDLSTTCSVHKDGNCKCEGDKCTCENCEEHNKKMTCSIHEEGNCKCEGDKCACANCEEHS